MKKENYNGWTNYPTWLVYCAINESDLYPTLEQKFVDRIIIKSDIDQEGISYILKSDIENIICDLEDELKCIFNNICIVNHNWFYADLLDFDLHEVNFHEIAEMIIWILT